MKYVRGLTLLLAVSFWASAAQAQYGLYGSPDMLQLPQAGAQTFAPYGAYPSVPPSPYQATGLVSHNSVTDLSGRPPAGLLPSPNSSLVDQMLSEIPAPYRESGGGGYADGSGDLTGCSEGCGDISCGGCATCCQPRWYAEGRYLTLAREKCTRLWTTYESGNNPNQLMKTCDTNLAQGHGGEIRLGQRFSCNTWALEAAYWGLSPMSGSSSMTHPNGVSTPLDFTDVAYANAAIPGLPVDLFDGAAEHRIDRACEVHNIEVNLVRLGAHFDCSERCNLDLLLGVRFFRFRDHLRFSSLDAGGAWSTPTDVGILDDQTINSLLGLQIGGDLNYLLCRNLSLSLVPKFGIYGNHMENRFQAFRGDGEAFAPDPGSGVPGSYPVNTNQNVVAFLTEVDLSVDWQMTPCWSAFIGYRLVVAADIALADRQIPPYVVDIPEIEAIDFDGELVLHGAFAGLRYNF